MYLLKKHDFWIFKSMFLI